MLIGGIGLVLRLRGAGDRSSLRDKIAFLDRALCTFVLVDSGTNEGASAFKAVVVEDVSASRFFFSNSTRFFSSMRALSSANRLSSALLVKESADSV
jgi:hypothetical protein